MVSPVSFLAETKQRENAAIIDACAVVLCAGLLEGVCDTFFIRAGPGPLIGCALFLYQFGFTAYADGRTLGRKLLHIGIVSVSGCRPSLLQALLRSSVRAVPLFFFTDDSRRNAVVWLVVSSEFIADYVLLTWTVTRQTAGDRLARTLVIKIPPLQPHRAPAAPMFSATDREFGIPPRWVDERPKGRTRSVVARPSSEGANTALRLRSLGR